MSTIDRTIDLASTGSWALNTAAKEALKDGGNLKVQCNGQIYQIELRKGFLGIGSPRIKKMSLCDRGGKVITKLEMKNLKLGACFGRHNLT
ncbi:MAG: hypothetical protein LBS71_01480, partial [Puniceicoccales bacterium]|nr:hypothetical protein [Puniceicoccales bacterium]